MELFSIVAPILFIVVILVIFTLRSRKNKPKAEKVDHHTRQDRAVWAWTKLLASERSPESLAGMVRVKMKLEVHLRGEAPYEADTTWLVEEEALDYVEVGKEVPVKVDPTAPQFVYPQASWARFVE
jgi:heme/copper-type cytochrome/quinol oxidase subunit 2